MVAQTLYQYRIFTNIEALKFQLSAARGITSNQDGTGCSVLCCQPRLLIQQDFAWFCKILQDFARFCKILQDSYKIGNIFTKDFLKKLPKIEANFTNFEVWSSKTELPKIEITNIEGYQYRGIPIYKYSKTFHKNFELKLIQ